MQFTEMLLKFSKADGSRIPKRNSVTSSFIGTLLYAPLACHKEDEQTPKDDVESWFYMMVELFTGTTSYNIYFRKYISLFRNTALEMP